MSPKLINTCIFNILRKFWFGLKTCSLSRFRHWGRVTHICVSKLTIIGSDNNKNHPVRYSVQLEPPKKSPSQKTRVWNTLPCRFLRGFWLNRIPNKWCVLFYPVFLWIFILMGNIFYFHNPFYLLILTSNSLCWSVHLNCSVSRQSLYIQATTTARSCDQLFNDIRMGSCDQTHLESFRMGLNQKGSNWIIQPLLGLIWSLFINL